jgi:hypothetical protein
MRIPKFIYISVEEDTKRMIPLRRSYNCSMTPSHPSSARLLLPMTQASLRALFPTLRGCPTFSKDILLTSTSLSRVRSPSLELFPSPTSILWTIFHLSPQLQSLPTVPVTPSWIKWEISKEFDHLRNLKKTMLK